ncbi:MULTISPECIES: GtrA family protein [unclassified Actinomyces]|uniref:GtrA family protein n=1 Tax=unclassified Actinomyces TaxID=2609248 RepID=UPI002016C3B9|nr:MULTISPECIES: GtrA family protein [unclassified Actinomyces]MCL3776963.1 GtrA family protein [Actinomyces sp. AC-20-1]MCL3790233.1 GtrA family protein [Actinomyces sp. 187325]MCL3792757.1 GtrA family protein [Actinomyces sp. 186855]MCL3795235.1 GtrA family protein [Actinomyces sp. 217892]
MSPSSTSLRGRLVAWVREFVQFGLVGALAFGIDAGLFNLFQHGPLGFLSGHPNTANVLSATIATVFSWVTNRLWTYRGRTQDNAAREALLFAFANVGGVLITQFCLFFTHEVLEMTSPLADNVAAYVVGFALGTAFRFVFYHYIVFTGTAEQPESPGSVTVAVVGGAPATRPSSRQGQEGPTPAPRP